VRHAIAPSIRASAPSAINARLTPRHGSLSAQNPMANTSATTAPNALKEKTNIDKTTSAAICSHLAIIAKFGGVRNMGLGGNLNGRARRVRGNV